MNRFENATDEQEKEPENAKQSNMLENVPQEPYLTLFGEINQDVARKTAEEFMALATN